MRQLWLALFLLAPTVVHGQTLPCNPEESEECTLTETFNFYRKFPVNVSLVQKTVRDEVVRTNRPTSAPDTFAGQLHNSYQDYLNLLSFAIKDVQESEDGKGLVVRFNPLRERGHLIGITLTASEPQIAESISNAIPESMRSSTIAALSEQLGDVDDLTWSASYSWSTPRCRAEWQDDDDTRCFGRSPKTYRDIVSLLLMNPEPIGVDEELEIAEEIQRLFPGPGSKAARRLSELTQDDRVKVIAAAKRLARIEEQTRERALAFYRSKHLDIVPTLIDNQPQVSGTATYRTRGDLGGPESVSASVELHFGRNNINSLRRSCSGRRTNLAACLQNQLTAYAEGGLLTDKIVVTASYRRANEYDVPQIIVRGAPLAGFTPVAAPRSTELNVKVQGGRLLGTEMTGEPLRADLSLEGVRVLEGRDRTQNRWIGTVTLSIPLGEDITIPVSLRYANKPEFLADAGRRINAHLGISYRLPSLFGE